MPRLSCDQAVIFFGIERGTASDLILIKDKACAAVSRNRRKNGTVHIVNTGAKESGDCLLMTGGR